MITGTLGPKPFLKDFKLGEWYPAAGRCDSEEEDSIECHEPMQVKRIDRDWVIFRCAKGHEQEDNAGWGFVKDPIQFQDRYYWGLSKRGNHSPCVSCGRIVYDILLILWGPGPDVKWELDFCFECVEKIPVKIGSTPPIFTEQSAEKK